MLLSPFMRGGISETLMDLMMKAVEEQKRRRPAI
jgi:hypothetical protein